MRVPQFEALIPKAERPIDRHWLYTTARLMRHAGLDPHQFAARGELGIAEIAASFVRDGGDGAPVPALLQRPGSAARPILFALSRLYAQQPAAGLPPVSPPEDGCLRVLAPECEPLRLRQQLASWRPRIVGEDSDAGCGRAIQESAQATYIQTCRQLWAVCATLGLPAADEVGIEELTDPEMIDLWFPVVASHYSGKGLAPFTSAIKRIALDKLGADHPNVAALRAVVSRHFAPRELDPEQVQRLRRLADGAPGATAVTLWDAPQAIMARAREAGLAPREMDSRATSAVAVAILISSPGLEPADLAGLDLTRDLRDGASGRELGRRLPDGTVSWEALSTEASDLLDQLTKLRRSTGRGSRWLFPRRGGAAPQERRVAMNGVCAQLSIVLGERITTSDIRDTVGLVAIEAAPEHVREISAALGQRATRSSERRYRLLLDRPARGTGGTAS